ncbi:transposase InsO family protein [Paraburkholderia sp. WSM4177]|nr:transposase InsO family protein [Paraburkholderia sp. WSM4177]MBB5487469.1 transposase InsO family protein [Paraburkholderia sp. WSM4180]
MAIVSVVKADAHRKFGRARAPCRGRFFQRAVETGSPAVPTIRRTSDQETASQAGIALQPETQIKATTKLTHGLPVASNLLDQAFAVTAPNEAWCGDTRYIATKPSKPHEFMPQKPC